MIKENNLPFNPLQTISKVERDDDFPFNYIGQIDENTNIDGFSRMSNCCNKISERFRIHNGLSEAFQSGKARKTWEKVEEENK